MAKKFIVGLLIFCGFCRSWGAGDAEGPSVFEGDHREVELSSCDDIPSGIVDVRSDIKVTGAITCASTKSLKVSSGNSVMVYSNYDLVVFGVHFVVEPGAELNFVANGDIVLERSESMKHVPVIAFNGNMVFIAGEDIPENLFQTPREGEKQTVLSKLGNGDAITTPGLVLTENAVIVPSKFGDSSSEDQQQAKESRRTDAGMTTDRLKVNEVLRGHEILTSSNGACKLWPGHHGCLLFADHADEEAIEDGQAFRPVEPRTLIPANKARVKGALRVRAKLQQELAGDGPRVQSSTPWSPWGRRYDRQVQTAREHAGEVELTLDSRACLEVTVDGHYVLSRSGPYSREWMNKFRYFGRARSPDYELEVVADGMEVRREGRKVWGVSVPK